MVDIDPLQPRVEGKGSVGDHWLTPFPTPTLHSMYSNQRWGILGCSLGVGVKSAKSNSHSLLNPPGGGLTVNWERS